MPDTSPLLGLPYLLPAQAQKHVTHNEALRIVDVLLHLAVLTRHLTMPPASPSEHDRHIIGVGAGGDWAGHDGKIALRETEGWQFLTPGPGWRAQVLEEGIAVVFDGGLWRPERMDQQNLPPLGIGTTADATNVLAVAGAATLLTHDGAGHQLKINKSAGAETASLLFQSGWSGRAEMGLAGSDDFAVKVSADGSAWQTGLQIAGATGRLAAPSGLEVAGLITGTGLRLAGSFHCPVTGTADALSLTYAGLGGPVAGLEMRFRAGATNTGATTINLNGTGAIACRTITGLALPAGYIRPDADTRAWFDGSCWVLDRAPERGANANGEYLRLSDGGQFCTGQIVLAYNTASNLRADWTMPGVFVVNPRVCATIIGSSTSMAPGLDMLGPVIWTNSGSNTTTARLTVYRQSGTVDFVSGNSLSVMVTAIGRWF